MGTYFIGIDYGTVHTKVCVREDVAPFPSAVIVSPKSSGPERFLIPSMGPNWTDRDAPKILLCSKGDNDPRQDARAMNQAVDVLSRAIKSAVAQIDAQAPSRGHTFIVQVGFPSAEGIDTELAKHRYLLAVDQAIDERVKDARVRAEREPLDERAATLALLDKARYQFEDEPLLVIDAGGWTTHASFLRWVKDPPAFSIHGYETVLHGVQEVVRTIRYSLNCPEHDAERALDAVLHAVYMTTNTAEINLVEAQQKTSAVSAALARTRNITSKEAEQLMRFTLPDFHNYVEHARVDAVFLNAWAGGWTATPGTKHYERYRLVLLGGACRIGRAHGRKTIDPLAAKFKRLQELRRIPFTDIVYPELNRQFWAFEPQPDESAVPYLFVAGGYTWPLHDWPASIQRTVLEPLRPRERRPWEDPESEPG
jgi:hypothetical protein